MIMATTTTGYRWIQRPDSAGMAWIDIRGTAYRLALSTCGRFAALAYAGGCYSLDLAAGECSCPDAKYRRRPGGCKHIRELRLALRDLRGVTTCVHSRRDRPCFLPECLAF